MHAQHECQVLFEDCCSLFVCRLWLLDCEVEKHKEALFFCLPSLLCLKKIFNGVNACINFFKTWVNALINASLYC